jgi:hypothetical protein
MKPPSRRPSPALVISIIALFVALGGTSVAAFKLKANSDKTRTIKNGAVTTEKLAPGATIDNAKKATTASTATSATSATTAANAAHAGTADAFSDGSGPNDFVAGSGIQFAGAAGPDDGEFSGVLFGAEGELDVHCDATPELTWENDRNDAGTPVTDIWTDADGHTTVADGTGFTSLDADMSNQSTNVTIWTGDDLIFNVHVSAFWNAGQTQCATVFFTNIEQDGFSTAAAADAGQVKPKLVGSGAAKSG